MTHNYRVFAALREDADKGLVYLAHPTDLRSRRVIKLRNLSSAVVFCECVKLDDSDVNHYNTTTHGRDRIPIPGYADVIVINKWYRKALNFPPRPRRPAVWSVPLEVSRAFPLWGSVRAGCQHPDPFVRLATILGVVGTWLGVSGLLFGLMAGLNRLCPRAFSEPELFAVVLSLILTIPSFLACRPVRP